MPMCTPSPAIQAVTAMLVRGTQSCSARQALLGYFLGNTDHEAGQSESWPLHATAAATLQRR